MLLIVVIVMMLVLSVFVINDLRWMQLFQVQPKPDGVDDQADDADGEEFHLEVRGDQLKQQAQLRLEQHG